MSIALTTPTQIAMWVLLSRRAQIKLHLKGVSVPGLVKWCRANIDGCENTRTVKQCIVPVEYAIATAGGPQDFSLVNVHVMINEGEFFSDVGIFSDMSEVEALTDLVSYYQNGDLEIVYTLDKPRGTNGRYYVPE